ncbi:MAG: TonB-dependent receptor, partial [Gemmatimonadetes bacterium]|nr:TonB-dependent receptor [Gemmatimonadota bacterium]
PSNVVRGIDLRAAAEASLGETLADEPGVNSSYHGPGASRPLIRGLGGGRVRILESGVGVGDVSDTSPDHQPAVEVATADRIEVIRGPATLLYGGSAIGGVVNVEAGRIPQELPAHPLTGSFTARGGTVSDERNIAGRVDGAVGRIAVHVSGLYRNTDDYSIPGHAALEEEGEHEGEEEGEGDFGVLGNSAVETSRFAGGLSYVGDNGLVGVSFSGYDSEYGVPGGHAHHEEGEGGEEAEEEEGDVGIDLRQRRVDLEAAWRFGGSFVRGLNARFGLADYEHFEVIADEGSGAREVDTEFFNDEWEGRLELEHSLGGSSNGVLGLQALDRDFEAIGEEAFVPPTTTTQFAVFAFEQFELGDVRLQLGARVESQDTENVTGGVSRDDTGFSASIGAVVPVSDAVSLVLSGARSTKLPAATELFANGPHLGTRSFEIGDPNLEREVGYNVNAGIRLSEGRLRGELSFFVNSFDQFIYLVETGEEEDELPVFQWTQADAVFTGFEAQADLELFHSGDGHFVLDASADYVRAQLSDTDEALPRIPPFRFRAGLGYESPEWHGHAGVTRVARQGRVAAFEGETDGYTMVNASLGYRLFGGGRTVHDIILSGRNLTDEEARSHTSVIKAFAPLPGREIRLTYQIGF